MTDDTRDITKAMLLARTPPSLIYAFLKTDRILSKETYKRLPKKDQKEWDDAIKEWYEYNGDKTT